MSIAEMEDQYSIKFNDINSFKDWCTMISKAEACPKAYRNKPCDVMFVVQYGLEVGFKPMQGLNSLKCINGKITMDGDAMLALCISKGIDIVESFDASTMTATCIVKRKGKADKSCTFSKTDAIKAKLWNKEGPWTTYPERMLRYRALGFGLRDSCQDILKGIISTEEALDYEVKSVQNKKQERIVNIVADNDHEKMLQIEENSETTTPMTSEELIEEVHWLITAKFKENQQESAMLKILEHYNIDSIDKLTEEQAKKTINSLSKRPDVYEEEIIEGNHVSKEALKELNDLIITKGGSELLLMAEYNVNNLEMLTPEQAQEIIDKFKA